MVDNCRWCGKIHLDVCPRVKSITFYADGETVSAVEFFPSRGVLVPISRRRARVRESASIPAYSIAGEPVGDPIPWVSNFRYWGGE